MKGENIPFQQLNKSQRMVYPKALLELSTGPGPFPQEMELASGQQIKELVEFSLESVMKRNVFVFNANLGYKNLFL